MPLKQRIGYPEALRIRLETIFPLGRDGVFDLGECLDRIASENRYSRVDSSSIDGSLKDGYAVRSDEIEHAKFDRDVPLTIIGTTAAGSPTGRAFPSGTAVRILTGGKLPERVKFFQQAPVLRPG